jgi:serine/threonine-protein kinase RsbT
MGESQTLIIRGKHDIITARLLVRRLARAKGFDIADQARIALASSSLAHALGLGMRRGQVTIDCLNDGARTGVRVVCTKADGATRDLAPEALDVVRFMVDELTVETLPGDDLQVTLVKWMNDSGGVECAGGVHD